MPQISVVSPVYKTAKYLRGCLDSILAQTFTDFELLLIDNGGTDECPAICDEYAAKDSRVRVLHLPENIGIAGARNVGLDEARGNFLMYMDSDDFLAPDALEVMYNRILTDDSDYAVCGVVWEDWTKGERDFYTYPDSVVSTRLEKMEYAYTISYVFIHLWNKLFKMDFVRASKFRFDTKCGYVDDFIFAAQCLIAAHRVSIVKEPFYVHYIHGANEGLKQLPVEQYVHGYVAYSALINEIYKDPSIPLTYLYQFYELYTVWARSVTRGNRTLKQAFSDFKCLMAPLGLMLPLPLPASLLHVRIFRFLVRHQLWVTCFIYIRIFFSPVRKVARLFGGYVKPDYRGGLEKMKIPKQSEDNQ